MCGFMGRTRANAKKAGTLFETQCSKFITEKLGQKIIRAPKSGAADKGDLYGLTFGDKDVVVECKSPGRNTSWSLSGWWGETEKEMDNSETDLGVLAIKRFNKPIEQAFCVLDDKRWENINGGLHTAEIVKSVPNSKWGELVDNHGFFATPRRGKVGMWYVTSLDKLMDIFAHYKEELTVQLDSQNLEELHNCGTITTTSLSGDTVVITLGSFDN